MDDFTVDLHNGGHRASRSRSYEDVGPELA
jgi:hypothetical protein